jgi:uncharacterized membrane-anchored protein
MKSFESAFMSKVAQVTLLFWIMKMIATVLGETAGDMLSMTFNLGYAATFGVVGGLFLILLVFQLRAKSYHPVLYWSVMLTTLIAGTALSDFMDRTLGLGYMAGATLLSTALGLVLLAWYATEQNLSVSRIVTIRAEAFYWVAILVSNTLGTAVGDFLADDSGLGFAGGALLIGSLLIAVVLVYYTTRTSHVLLFWAAYILTRPFGATFGDVLTKPTSHGGLELGTVLSSSLLIAVFLGLLILAMAEHRKPRPVPEETYE